ncbi:hypothetical protein C8Q78DRAFT_377832 [Trametes maxima]|nr:hypothetical protein C8Q78DRAFT_377832 [Trametes maxima]
MPGKGTHSAQGLSARAASPILRTACPARALASDRALLHAERREPVPSRQRRVSPGSTPIPPVMRQPGGCIPVNLTSRKRKGEGRVTLGRGGQEDPPAPHPRRAHDSDGRRRVDVRSSGGPAALAPARVLFLRPDRRRSALDEARGFLARRFKGPLTVPSFLPLQAPAERADAPSLLQPNVQARKPVPRAGRGWVGGVWGDEAARFPDRTSGAAKGYTYS